MKQKQPLSLEALLFISSLLAITLFAGIGYAMRGLPDAETAEEVKESVEEEAAETEEPEKIDAEEESVPLNVTINTNTARPDTTSTVTNVTATNTETEKENETKEASAVQTQIDIVFSITSPNGKQEYALKVDANTTVEAAMDAARATGLQFTAETYSGVGSFVTEINGLSQNKKQNMFWVYYINGKSATNGISSQIVKDNDVIRWNYEKSY